MSVAPLLVDEQGKETAESGCQDPSVEQGLDAPLLVGGRPPPSKTCAEKMTAAATTARAKANQAATATVTWLHDTWLRSVTMLSMGGGLLYLLFSFECTTSIFQDSLPPYSEDAIDCFVETTAQLPWNLLAIENSFKVILVFAVFGFDLKFSKPSDDKSLLKRITKCCLGLLKAIMSLGLISLALQSYYKDFQKLAGKNSNTCSEQGRIGPIGRMALLPVVVTLSPNYSAAVALWSKLAIQSPAAALRMRPRYRTFSGSFIGAIGFPVYLGEADWLPVLTQIYALILLPYIFFKRALLLAVNFLLFGNVFFDLACFRCKWVIVCVASCGASFCYCLSIALVIATCMSSWALGYFHYWAGWLWPGFFMGYLALWAAVTPKLLVLVYCVLANLGWRVAWRGVWQASPRQPSAFPRWLLSILSKAFTDFEELGWGFVWQSLRNKMFVILTTDIWAGLPGRLALQKDSIIKLWEYNHTSQFEQLEMADLKLKDRASSKDNFDETHGADEQRRSDERDMTEPMDVVQKEMGLGDKHDDLLSNVKVAIVYSTLQSVSYIMLQQISVLYIARFLMVVFEHQTYTDMRNAMKQTLFERRVGSWAQNLKALQDHYVSRLFNTGILSGLTTEAHYKSVLEDICIAPHKFTWPSISADMLYVLSVVLVLMGACQLLRPSLRYAQSEAGCKVRIITAGCCLFILGLCAMTHADFEHAQHTSSEFTIAVLLLVIRVFIMVALVRTLPSWPEAPAVLRCLRKIFFPKISRGLDFFLGLDEEHNEDSANAFVQQVIKWGGIYPKLAQRLRTDSAVVKSEALREAFKEVMEHCKPRGDFEVIDHLRRQLLLRRSDVEVKKTLGTGSVAQVALIRYRKGEEMVDAVMKMTWPKDEKRFIDDFALFEFLQRYLTMVTWLVGEQENFAFFLKTVLAKKVEILHEFDLTNELINTVHGKKLVEKWAQVVVEQGVGSVPTRLQLQSEAIEQGLSFGESKAASKADLTKFVLDHRCRGSFAFKDVNGTVVTLQKSAKEVKCILQHASNAAPFKDFDWETRQYWIEEGGQGTVPRDQMANLQAYLDTESKFYVGQQIHAKYKNGTWCRGTISSVNDDDTYMIDWADDDSVDRIKSSEDINVIFVNGDDVIVKGGFGKVSSKDESKYTILFHDDRKACLPDVQMQRRSFKFTNLEGAVITILGVGPGARCVVQEAGLAGAFEGFNPETRKYRTGCSEGTVPEEQVESLRKYLSIKTRYLPKTINGALVLLEVRENVWRLDDSQLKSELDGMWIQRWSGKSDTINVVHGKWTVSGSEYQLKQSSKPLEFVCPDGAVQQARECSEARVVWSTMGSESNQCDIVWVRPQDETLHFDIPCNCKEECGGQQFRCFIDSQVQPLVSSVEHRLKSKPSVRVVDATGDTFDLSEVEDDSDLKFPLKVKVVATLTPQQALEELRFVYTVRYGEDPEKAAEKAILRFPANAVWESDPDMVIYDVTGNVCTDAYVIELEEKQYPLKFEYVGKIRIINANNSDDICYRLSKNVHDEEKGHTVAWGTSLTGSDQGDGWVKVDLVDEFNPEDNVFFQGSVFKIHGGSFVNEGRICYHFSQGEGYSKLHSFASNLSLVPFTFTDSDGAKVTIFGRGLSARCEVERPGEAGAFNGFDSGSRRYKTGAGEGSVSAEEAEKLQKYLEGTLTDFTIGDIVFVKSRPARICFGPDSDGGYRVVFDDTGDKSGYIAAKALQSLFFNFTDDDGAIVTLWPEDSMGGSVMRCSVQDNWMPFTDFEPKSGRFLAGDAEGIVPNHRLRQVEGFLAAETMLSHDDLVSISGTSQHWRVKSINSGVVTLVDLDGNKGDDCIVSTLEKVSAQFKIRVPECVTHGRHVLEQQYVKGHSLNEIMESMTSLDQDKYAGCMQIWPQSIDEKVVKGAFNAYTQGFVPILGSMLFHDGFGHADPHGGNLIYNRDEDTLWVIDWGATVQLDEEERRGFADLVQACALGEVKLPADTTPISIAPMLKEAELALTGAQGAGVACNEARLGMWRYILHPSKYPKLPEGIDLDDLKKQLDKVNVVLCLETAVLTSRLVSNASSQAEKRNHGHLMSLLGLWNDAVDISPPATSLVVVDVAAMEEEAAAETVRQATIFRASTAQFSSGSGTVSWAIPPDRMLFYRKLFKATARPGADVLSGDVARVFFEKSGLPVVELSHIWHLADTKGNGCLTIGEFACAVHMASLRRKGVTLPQELPPELAVVAASSNELAVDVTEEEETAAEKVRPAKIFRASTAQISSTSSGGFRAPARTMGESRTDFRGTRIVASNTD